MLPLRVTLLLPYPSGRAPGQRFRVEQWLSLLPPGQVEATILPLFSEGAYGRLYEPGGQVRKAAQTVAGLGRRMVDSVRATRADVVFLYREAFPLGPALIERLVERRVPVVYDFDDAIWLGDTSAANATMARFKRPAKVARIIEGAAMTTVGNEYLATYACQHSDAVSVIPTTLDVEEYQPRPRPPNDVLRLGWSGSPTTSPHLARIAGALRRALYATDTELELTVVGDASFRLPGPLIVPERVTATAWSREAEIADVSGFDIGLMPLPDDEWSRGKCGFKALLYMALGVPVIASPGGVNTEIVTHRENGLLATTEDEWVEAIRMLAEDPALRARLASAGRATVVDRYSGQRWAPIFRDVLETAAARPPGA